MTSEPTMLPSGSVTSPQGFRAAGVYAGLRGKPVPDLGILISDRPATAAGRYTKNKVRAAGVRLTQRHVDAGDVRAVIVNSACANACTGAEGEANALEMARLAAAHAGLRTEQVAACSTGLIGSQLPMDKVAAGIAALEPAPEGGDAFARAIMTTDKVHKSVAVEFGHGGVRYVVGGAAKGSGMIHPDMATMLSFLTTDAAIARAGLDAALGEAVDATYNMLTVDGDNSTNDTVLLLANGAAGGPELAGDGLAAFRAALLMVCTHLVRMLARDAEGAERIIVVRVAGAASLGDARRAARTVAGSMLLKSAVHGGDPNWGRAVAAIGRSGVEIDPARLRLTLGDVLLFSEGTPYAFDKAAAEAAMRGEEVVFSFQLGLGDGEATAWGCDLTEEYVRFNSEYTT